MDVRYPTTLCQHVQDINAEAILTGGYQLLSQVFNQPFQLRVVAKVFDSYQKLGYPIPLKENNRLLLCGDLTNDLVDDLGL